MRRTPDSVPLSSRVVSWLSGSSQERFMEKQLLDGEKVFVVRGFLTTEECAEYIALAEGVGFDEAPITTSVGFVMRKDIRSNDRVMIDDTDVAQRLFERARPFLPEEWFGWHLCGLNERFRYYR